MAIDDTADEAYRKILRYLSVREQSSSHIYDKLARAGFDSAAIKTAIERAVNTGVLNDYRYADALIRTALSSGKGLQGALQEIEDLGIDPNDIDSYREHVLAGDDEEIERALSFLRSHPPRSKNVLAGSYRKLTGRGYSSSVAESAAKRFCEEQAISTNML